MSDNHGRPLVRVAVAGGAAVSAATLHNVAGATVAGDGVVPLNSASGMVPLSAHLATIEALQASHRDTVKAIQEHAVQAEQHHARERQIDHAMAWLVIAAGVGVLAIVGPVVIKF